MLNNDGIFWYDCLNHLKEAQQRLIYRLDQIRQAQVYGVRPRRTFEEAAAKYLAENQHKRTIEANRVYIEQLRPYIGQRELDTIHMGCLQPFIEMRQQQGVKNRTINHGLQMVRRIRNLASKEWVDDTNLTWLGATSKIRLLPQNDERKPSPLSWEEQTACLRCCRLICAEWHYLRSTRGCAIKRFVACNGIGSALYRS